MENASKALIMAAEVLIGVIIISIGVTLFTMFQNFSKDNVEKMNESKITEFNNNFTKYYGKVQISNKDEEYIKVSAHDIISMVNFVIENNKYYDLQYPANVSLNSIESTMYVKIDIKNDSNVKNGNGIENWNEEDKNEFIIKNSLVDGVNETGKPTKNQKYYKMIACEISKDTKRVYYVAFQPI